MLWTLFGIFLIGSPILIAYAFGYIVDFKTRGLTQTGGIFLKSKTPDVSIFLDGSFRKKTSFISRGALLTDIAPGTHLLRIEKENHTPWSKTVSVEPSLVANFRNILLIPKPVPIATSSPAETARLKKIIQYEDFTSAVNKSATATSSPLRNISYTKKKTIIEKVGTTTIMLAENVEAFVNKDDGTIFFIDKNGFLARIPPETTSITTLGRPGFFMDQPRIRFVASPGPETFILDSSGGIFLVDRDDTVRPIDQGVIAIRFDGENKKALFVKESGASIFWLQDNPKQPFEKRGAIEKIISVNPLENKIEDARWFFDDDAHVVLKTKNGIFFTEIDGRGGRMSSELFSGKTDGLLTTPENPDSIFFTQRKKMYRIDLR